MAVTGVDLLRALPDPGGRDGGGGPGGQCPLCPGRRAGDRPRGRGLRHGHLDHCCCTRWPPPALERLVGGEPPTCSRRAASPCISTSCPATTRGTSSSTYGHGRRNNEPFIAPARRNGHRRGPPCRRGSGRSRSGRSRRCRAPLDPSNEAWRFPWTVIVAPQVRSPIARDRRPPRPRRPQQAFMLISLDRARDHLVREGLDAVIATTPINVAYAGDFASEFLLGRFDDDTAAVILPADSGSAAGPGDRRIRPALPDRPAELDRRGAALRQSVEFGRRFHGRDAGARADHRRCAGVWRTLRARWRPGQQDDYDSAVAQALANRGLTAGRLASRRPAQGGAAGGARRRRQPRKSPTPTSCCAGSAW